MHVFVVALLCKCSIHVPALCCMREAISKFISENFLFGLFLGTKITFFLLYVFRQQLTCFMHFAPWNVFLSASRMLLVKVVFAVCR